MTRSLWSVVAVLSASWVLAPATAQAGKSERAPASDAPDQTPSEFVRFVKVGDGGHLDTAITTYK
ncbi:MAG TPA: hypothetical protein VK348_03630, partial [Planctomycetota bacterium]|nr:hypothetical protein [Planctomycetota bacterium]